jgi:hypothetical protein
MMNLDLALSPALEAALEAHANALRLTEEAVNAGAAWSKAEKALRALPNHWTVAMCAPAVAEYDRTEAEYKAAQEAADQAETVLAAACEAAGIESL